MTHGPPPSWFGGSAMVWPQWPVIPVVDTIALGLRPRKADKWRRNRDRALASWSSAPLLMLTEEDPALHTTFDPDYADEEAELRRHIIPGALRFMRGNYHGRQGTAWSYPSPPGSVVMVWIGLVWWQATSPWRRQFVVTHEAGHGLGLNHRTDSTASVMYSVADMGGPSNQPDQHDLESLEDYFAPEVGPG